MKNISRKISLNSFRKLFLSTLLIIFSASLFAQKTEIDPAIESKLIKPYEKYFQSGREWVYTQLNKSSYITGDDVWFTSFILNPSNRQLNLATSKLYVELWSPQKNLVSRKILFVKEGTSSNYIHLPDSLPPGSYCFRAYTNWMRNFYPEKELSTFITILGNNKPNEADLKEKTKGKNKSQNSTTNNVPLTSKDNDYDIQLLPESGTLLEGADNIIGVKATDSFGSGIKMTGKVFSADNNEIAEVSTNEHGMGSFIIREATNQKYVFKADLPDNTKREIELPKVEEKGITIQVNPFRADVISFRLQTNTATSQINNTYFVTIHANGALFSNYRFQFLKNNSIQFRINKKDLGSGIIYATVFDKNFNPVAERVFYNQDVTGRGNLVFKAEPEIKDTIRMNISIIDSLNNVDFTKLSISVLPGGTQLSHFNNSLLAESILRPAVQGDIEDPNSYFAKSDFEHLAAIDLLLLTQGWRKYDWQAILQNPAPTCKYPFETAFLVEGVVKNWLKNKTDANSKISLFSPMNNLFLMAPVDKEGKYKFEKIYLADSTWVMVSATSEKGKNWNRAVQTDIPEYTADTPDFTQKPIPPVKINEAPQEIPKLMKDAILLSEVVIEGKKADPFSGNIYVSATDKIFEVTPENYRQFETIDRLLLMKFNVKTEHGDTSGGGSGYYFTTGRGALSLTASAQDLQALMYIDGMRVYDAQAILDLPLEYVEAVSVNKDGFGGGIGASGGIISIVTRKTPFFVNNAEATNMKKIMVHGYAKPMQYFTPKYNIVPGTLEYDRYAAIYWQPELTTDNKNNASFKFFVPREIKSLNIRAEGISVDGKVFLHEQKIEFPGKN